MLRNLELAQDSSSDHDSLSIGTHFLIGAVVTNLNYPNPVMKLGYLITNATPSLY
jgi:hypothetical protein